MGVQSGRCSHTVWRYVCTHVYECDTVYVYIATCIYVCLSGLWLGGLLHLSLHMYFHVHVCVCLCVCV